MVKGVLRATAPKILHRKAPAALVAEVFLPPAEAKGQAQNALKRDLVARRKTAEVLF
jgi:hypothetical protein